jgi:hypothetical protein
MNVNTEWLSRHHCCRTKARSITYSVCVCVCVCVCVALVIQHAKRMRPIILSCVAYLAVPYFSTLSHKRHDFRKKKSERQMCVLIFFTLLSATFFTLRRIQRDTAINVHRSSCKVPVILVTF